MDVRPKSRDFFLQRFRADAEIVCLSGRIDVGQNDMIRQGQRLCEVIHQSLCPAVGVRLEDAPERSVRIIFAAVKVARISVG